MNVGIVIDTTLDSDAGVQQYFKGLARYLIKRGHNVTFLVPQSINRGEFKGRIISLSKTFTPFISSTRVPISLPTSKKKIVSVLQEKQFDMIHIGAPFSPFLGAKVVENAQCPIVLTYLVITSNKINRLGLKILKLILKKAYKKIDAHIALTEGAYVEARAAIPGKYRIIPGGVNMMKYSPDQKPLKRYVDDLKTILFLGRLEKRKGVRYLLKAFAIVQKRIPNTRLIIAGDGPEREELETLAKRLKIKNVVFEGYIDEKLKPRYYASADICVFPSIFGESFGVVLVEALASGKVVLAYDNEGYQGVLKNLPKLLVRRYSVGELSRKIISFLSNVQKKKEYEVKCYNESKRFHWDVVGEQILTVYKSLL